MTNPLLDFSGLPRFSAIRPEHVGPAVDALLAEARAAGQPITTVVTYSCHPRRGLYFNRPEAAYPGRPAQIWTQGQAEDSPYYFPCVDYQIGRAHV